jgi:dinuclear metal center YbgI/SA1388 family protein
VSQVAGSPLPLPSVLQRLEELWPLAGAEEWDAPGLVVGDLDRSVSHIRLVVDAVPNTIAEAKDAGADLVISHHPLLLKPVHSVAEDRYKGRVVSSLIRHNMALLTAHTNADVVPTGTSQVLADALGLGTREVIVPSTTPGHGLGQVGVLNTPTTLYDLATTLGGVLPHTASGIRVSGDARASVTRVAVCAGAGDSLLSHPLVTSADVYITSDLRHHPASEVQAQRDSGHGPALVDISHFAAEWMWVEAAGKELQQMFPDLTISVSDLVTDPWDFVVLPG